MDDLILESTRRHPAVRWFCGARRVVPPVLLWAISGCGAGNPTEIAALRTAVNEHEARWIEHGPADYRYTLRIVCRECPRDLDRPVEVEVRDGDPVSVTSAETGEPADRELFARFDTIDELFEQLEEAFDEGADSIRAEYEEQRGYPSNVFIDRDFNIADEELGWEVRSFEPIAP